jgi:hypothetical protein
MAKRQRDPNLPEDQDAGHPGAPPDFKKKRIAEDRTPGEEKPRRPVGNSQLPDEPAAFPPHN